MAGAALLAAATTLGAAYAASPASASGAPRAATVSVIVPDPAVKGCDVLLPAPAGHHCLLPWPNDAFTVTSKTATGRRLTISSKVDPANVHGVHVDTAAENAGDGFSPGSLIMTYVPGLSIAQSNIATSTNIGLSLASNAPIVILDTVTHARVPYFAELDAQTTNPAEQLLLDPPGGRADRGPSVRGRASAPGGRQRCPDRAARRRRRRAGRNAEAGVAAAHIKFVINHDLASVLGTTIPYQAWDFTVASAQSLAGPALTMRTQAYQWLSAHHRPAAKGAAGDRSRTGVRGHLGHRHQRRARRARHVPGAALPERHHAFSALVTNRAGNPKINGAKTWTANFICVLPSTVQSGGPATPTLYGHGLLGSASEVEGGSFSAGVAHDLMGCATDWVGMSGNDIPNVARNLQDMSTFDTQVDHMLQGFVNFQFLGRLINSSSGFVTNAAFQSGGQPLFKTHDCHFMGYSQGGIMGGAVSALSTEWTRAILGVPGMDYGGLLLNRSVDWNEFSAVFDPSYTDPVDQQVVLQLAQLLWDRGENEGYAEHLTSNPYPGIPPSRSSSSRTTATTRWRTSRPRCWRGRSAPRTTSPRSTRRSSARRRDSICR